MPKSEVTNGELKDKSTEQTFKTIINYMGKLLLAPMVLSLPTVRDLSDPPSP